MGLGHTIFGNQMGLGGLNGIVLTLPTSEVAYSHFA